MCKQLYHCCISVNKKSMLRRRIENVICVINRLSVYHWIRWAHKEDNMTTIINGTLNPYRRANQKKGLSPSPATGRKKKASMAILSLPLPLIVSFLRPHASPRCFFLLPRHLCQPSSSSFPRRRFHRAAISAISSGVRKPDDVHASVPTFQQAIQRLQVLPSIPLPVSPSHFRRILFYFSLCGVLGILVFRRMRRYAT